MVQVEEGTECSDIRIRMESEKPANPNHPIQTRNKRYHYQYRGSQVLRAIKHPPKQQYQIPGHRIQQSRANANTPS